MTTTQSEKIQQHHSTSSSRGGFEGSSVIIVDGFDRPGTNEVKSIPSVFIIPNLLDIKSKSVAGQSARSCFIPFLFGHPQRFLQNFC
jgi:hypothetical protein